MFTNTNVKLEVVKSSELAENAAPRFHLMDEEELKANYGCRGQQEHKAAGQIRGESILDMDLTTVLGLPNSEVDAIIGEFYCAARQKNGELYCKKTMQAIRFGLQRFFINESKCDITCIIVHADFAR